MPDLSYAIYDADNHDYEPDVEFADERTALPPEAVRKLMRENLAGLVQAGV